MVIGNGVHEEYTQEGRREGRRAAKKARNDRSESCVRADSTSSLPSRPRRVQARVSCSAADGRRFVLGEAGLVVEAGEVARVVALHVLAALLLAVPGFADDTERGTRVSMPCEN